MQREKKGDAVAQVQEGDGQKPAIAVETGTSGEEVVLRVRDNGPGIPADLRERILGASAKRGHSCGL